MKNLSIKWAEKSWMGMVEPLVLLGLLLLTWPAAQRLILRENPTAGYVDPGIWLLILLATISFLLSVALSAWLLQRFWMALGLSPIGIMVLRFNSLEVWQQLGFYWASFVALLFAAIGCLIAIC